MALTRRVGFNTIASAVAIGAAAAFATPTHAGITPPALDFTLQVNTGAPIVLTPQVNQNGSHWHWYGSYATANWSLQSDIYGGPEGPEAGVGTEFINGFMALQNLTANTNTYTITVNMATSPIAIATLMDGSVGGAVTDSNGNGIATAGAAAGSSIYLGLINGSGVGSTALLPFPYSVSVINSGGTETIGPASFGQPVPIVGPSGVNSIGIQLQVTLTPGDTAVLTGFFRVAPIPAPAGLALVGLAGLVGRSRHRSA